MNLWSREGKRPEMGRRTWVLLGVLVLAVLWALSENKRPGPATPRGMSRSAIPSPVIALPATGAKVTPEGWGKDPFDPNRASVGSRDSGR